MTDNEWEYRRGVTDRRSSIRFKNGSIAVVYSSDLCRVLADEALKEVEGNK